MKNYWQHFKTITIHKWYVALACFRSGLILQGILHDLSKYSPIEFWASAKYFQGNKSPINAEKVARGYSIAWQHHKGHNSHHWEYWTDIEKGQLICVRIPPKYLAEMICDWIGAGKAYNKGKWTIETYRTWYANNRDNMIMHTSSKAYLDMVYENSTNQASLYAFISPKRIYENYILDRCEGCAYQPKYNLISEDI